MDCTRNRLKGIPGALLALAASVATATAAVDLGPRHVDPANGFSMRPPVAVTKSGEVAVNRLARWVRRDEKTGAIAWTLTVRREPGPPEGKSVGEFAPILARRYAARKDVRVESVQPGRLAGRDALFVQLQSGAKARFWQTEARVLADEGHFLVVAVHGPLGIRDRLEEIRRETTSTLRLLDREALAAARRANLARGRDLLRSISPGDLTRAARAEDRWYLYRRDGKDAGFFHLATTRARRGLTSGVQVRTFARLELRTGQVMFVRRVLFATPDRSKERWSETARVYKHGALVKRMSETGQTEGGVISCTISDGSKSKARRKPIPPALAAHYLPRAFAPLLPRLVDLDTPSGYAFATYTTAANAFDQRTLTVAEPEKIVLGSGTEQAVRLTDRVAADAAAAVLHVRKNGTLLRMRLEEGLAMELAGRRAVLRRYEDAEKMIEAR